MDWQQLASFITPMGFALVGLWRIAGWAAKRVEARFDQAEARRVSDKKEVKEALTTFQATLHTRLDKIEEVAVETQKQATDTNGRVTFMEGVMFGQRKPDPLEKPE